MKTDMRRDKQSNRDCIREQFLAYIEEHHKAPTYRELAKRVGVAKKTIERHMKEIDFGSGDSTFRVLTPEVVKAIYLSAISGNAGTSSDRKLWMQLFEGFNERTTTTMKFDPEQAIKTFESIFPKSKKKN